MLYQGRAFDSEPTVSEYFGCGFVLVVISAMVYIGQFV